MKKILIILTFFYSMNAFSQNEIAMQTTKNNQFAFDLFHKLTKVDENLFFSPFSISSALAMTYAGAAGNTETEMQKVLHFGANNEAFHQTFAALNKQISQKKELTLNVANSIWAQKSFGFLDSYLNLVKKNYEVGVEFVNFKKKPEKTRKQINEWVEQQTNNKIKDLLKPSHIDESTVMVLVNAIYFNGNWAKQFDKKKSKEQDFFVNKNDTVRSTLMFTNLKTKYFENDTVQMIELPYKNNEASMIVIMPPKGSDFFEFAQQFEMKQYLQYQRQMKQGKALVYLPKFKLTKSETLSKTLAEMGMPSAFRKADFSLMTGKKNLAISEVIHKAFVDVSETGTEAAAATAVVMMRATVSIKNKPFRFRADHPFIFLIKENSTGAILFMGSVYDPTN